MSAINPSHLQDCSARPIRTGTGRRTDWTPILLRLKDGPLVAAAWGRGDPETIPEEFFELPEQAADWDSEEILGPPPGAEDDAGMPAPVAKSVPAGGELPPPYSPTQSRFTPLSLSEIGELPPLEWLIDNLVPEDGLVVLYGEPAAGKSFVALDWGLSVATGAPWLGHKVKQGEVVYIYAEGVRGLKARADAWLQEHGKADPPSFRAVRVPVNIPDPNERGEFVKAVRSVSKHPRLIIIDTLARNFGEGNESAAQDMNTFVRGCDDLRSKFPDATVLVVHHPGKDQRKGARGSLALKGAADAEFALTRSEDGLTLKNEKQKDGEEVKPISLELTRVTLPDGKTSRVVRLTKGSMVGASATEPKKDPRIVKTDTGTLQALAAFGAAGAALADWQRAVGRANDTFYKSRARLEAAGKVVHDKENARYIAAEPDAGPGSGLVQNGSNGLEVH
jgi:hypothetical protein